MRETDIRIEAIHRTPHLPGGAVSYTADIDGGLIGGRLTFEFDLEPPAPRGHLLTVLHAERPDDPESMRDHLDAAAAQKLEIAPDQNTSLSSHAGNLTATTIVLIPSPGADLPSNHSNMPYLSGEGQRALSSDHEATLPELTRTIGKVLPPELQTHAQEIIRYAAQQLPHHKDILTSYQHTSVPEVLAAYDQSKKPAPRIEYSNYSPAAAPNPELIYLQLRIDREPNPANRARLDAAEDALYGLGGSHYVSESFNNVATEHLQKLTRSTALLVEDGWAVGIHMDLPLTPTQSALLTAPGPGGQSRPPLTAEQETLLPELAETIDAILPPHHRQHTQNLALMVAAEVPSTADAITATDQVTVEEIIEHHEQRMESYLIAALPEPMRTVGLSFPRPASTALHQPNSTSPAAAATARPARTVTLER
ncbi:hypothetical protein [[Micrococcus luteus] ATCC 49442]|uniref:hypothetical protein n=1 Tax=[Micrococcus luteus] ATCC 49442 TaxID=2698727 RepID=UPI0013DA8EE7|nr:hypothetical protein [[Micrococcus luteus] ATCC 49442]